MAHVGAVKYGDPSAVQWRQDMQVEWLRAAIRAQERRDEPEIDLDTLRMPSWEPKKTDKPERSPTA